MNILVLRGFNNYFNRIVKKYSTLADYRADSSSYIDLSNINFNPNDGVATVLILGNSDQKENNQPLDWENIGTPDYLVCYENGANNTTTIISRWFILESERTRKGQYRIALKRDIVAEHIGQIKTAPCFIEKGTIQSADDPLLFNNESMTYNQIKTDEVLLRDESQVPWIVGFVPSDLGGSQQTAYWSTSVSFNSVGGIAADSTTSVPKGLDVAYIELSYTTGGYTKKIKATPYTNNPIYNGFQATYTADYDASHGQLQYRASTGTGPENGSGTITVYINNPIPITGYVNKALSDEIINTAIPAENLPWTFTPASTELGVLDSWIEHYAFYNQIDGGYKRNIVVDLKYEPTNHTSSSSILTPTKTVQTGSKGAASSSPELSWRWYSNKSGSGDGDFSLYGDYNILKTCFTRGAFDSTQAIYELLEARNIYIFNGDPSILSQYDNKYVSYNGHYYKIYLTAPSSATTNLIQLRPGDTGFTAFNSNGTTSFGRYNSLGGTGVSIYAYSSSNATCDLQYYYRGYTVTAQEVTTNTTVTSNFPSDGARPHLADAPYDMFAIPYGITDVYKNGSKLFTVDKDVSMFMASSIATTIGSQKVYDIQLVPYCPFRQYIDLEEHRIDITGYDEDKEYDIVKEVTNLGVEQSKSIVLWGSRSNVTFDLSYSIPLPQYDENPVINKKIINETTLYRLCSPNYSGQFEFSLAKINGVLKFNVDLTYKPFNPYIHVNPDFKGLYGVDWDDARGLICGGDFSFPILTSAWADYQVSNKNYQEIFDRQIKNMDVNNQIAKEQMQWQKITGALTGGLGAGAGGALAGAKAGGGWGAVAGAAVGLGAGTALSIIGGEKDEDWLLRQQAETKDYAVDMYGYQLGNIQAMPYSLTKTSALTYNNKLYPIIEKYECTEKERNILKNKLTYDGMTIMAIGQISEYLPTTSDLGMVRGKMIRIENLSDDFHIADAIYQEIQKGVYLTSGLE